MSRVYCYVQRGKTKSRKLCAAFAAGCGGMVIEDGRLRDGPAAFYGIGPGMEPLWRQVQRDGRDYYFVDNSYFDATRERYFRVTRNAPQHSGVGQSTGERWRELGIQLPPQLTHTALRYTSGRILVCPQSDHFMHTVAGYTGNWAIDIRQALTPMTTRPVVVRVWSRDKATAADTLPAELEQTWLLVTWSSAAAITALMHGVPVLCYGPGAATIYSNAPIHASLIAPQLPNEHERLNWLGVLADNQWTMDELRAGAAWEALHPEAEAA